MILADGLERLAQVTHKHDAIVGRTALTRQENLNALCLEPVPQPLFAFGCVE